MTFVADERIGVIWTKTREKRFLFYLEDFSRTRWCPTPDRLKRLHCLCYCVLEIKGTSFLPFCLSRGSVCCQSMWMRLILESTLLYYTSVSPMAVADGIMLGRLPFHPSIYLSIPFLRTLCPRNTLTGILVTWEMWHRHSVGLEEELIRFQ